LHHHRTKPNLQTVHKSITIQIHHRDITIIKSNLTRPNLHHSNHEPVLKTNTTTNPQKHKPIPHLISAQTTPPYPLPSNTNSAIQITTKTLQNQSPTMNSQGRVIP
jgi:hypothetical protein